MKFPLLSTSNRNNLATAWYKIHYWPLLQKNLSDAHTSTAEYSMIFAPLQAVQTCNAHMLPENNIPDGVPFVSRRCVYSNVILQTWLPVCSYGIAASFAALWLQPSRHIEDR